MHIIKVLSASSNQNELAVTDCQLKLESSDFTLLLTFISFYLMINTRIKLGIGKMITSMLYTCFT